jgi:hypothetical protein
MLLCNTIAESLQMADFCEEIVMSRSLRAMTIAALRLRSARQARALPGD